MSVDVVVVGAGPAGCAAALGLLARGRSVQIVTRPEGIEKPTETAAPALPHLLRLLGAEDAMSACEPCLGIESDWGRTAALFRSAVANPHGHSWFVNRKLFDDILRRRVQQSGGAILEAPAAGVSIEAEGVVVGLGHGVVKAKWMVLATGSPAWTALATGQRMSSIDSLVAFHARASHCMSQRILRTERTPDGWWYICPHQEYKTEIVFVTDKECASALRPLQGDTWRKLFMKTRVSQEIYVPSGIVARGAPIQISELMQRWGKRWTAVGDAAMKFDPIGSGGIVMALKSGVDAAKAVDDALAGDDEAFGAYQTWGRSVFRQFGQQRADQYAIEARHHGPGFWQRRISSSELRAFQVKTARESLAG